VIAHPGYASTGSFRCLYFSLVPMLPQTNDRPVIFLSMALQRRVGVNRYGVGNLDEQGQIIQ
jgi:hypothetical protein